MSTDEAELFLQSLDEGRRCDLLFFMMWCDLLSYIVSFSFRVRFFRRLSLFLKVRYSYKRRWTTVYSYYDIREGTFYSWVVMVRFAEWVYCFNLESSFRTINSN